MIVGQVQMEMFGFVLIRALSCPHLDTTRTSSRDKWVGVGGGGAKQGEVLGNESQKIHVTL